MKAKLRGNYFSCSDEESFSMHIIQYICLFINKIENLFLLILFLCMFFIGLYGLYDSYLLYQDANYDNLSAYKPGNLQNTEVEKEIDGNMVAWLTLDNTSIDYPVMQGETNTEYLNKDPFGEYSLSGSIFLDSRNSSDFTDEYSLIYGHHMEHGYMFGALDEYLNEEYVLTHKTGKLAVGDITYNIEVCAVLETEATNEYVFAPTTLSRSEVLKYVEENALYFDEDLILNSSFPVLALSTCKYPDTADRTIIFTIIFLE